MLRITLKRSFIGRPEKHRKILKSLGLRKVNQNVTKEDIPSVRGMIHKVSHLIEVKESRDQEVEDAQRPGG